MLNSGNSLKANQLRNVSKVGGWPLLQPVVSSGSFEFLHDRIGEDDCLRINCLSDGICNISYSDFYQNPADAAYDMWNLWVLRAAGGGSEIIFHGGTNLGRADAAQYGYGWRLLADGTIRLSKYNLGAGTSTSLFRSAAATLADDTWAKLKCTRSGADSFTGYMDRVLIAAAVGTNPATSNTYTDANYVALEMDTGDSVGIPTMFGGFRNQV